MNTSFFHKGKILPRLIKISVFGSFCHTLLEIRLFFNLNKTTFIRAWVVMVEFWVAAEKELGQINSYSNELYKDGRCLSR